MSNITNRREFEERFDAYKQAIRPTSQLMAELSEAFAQMMADDTAKPAYIGVMGIRVVREPKRETVK
jgi:hypothetical protein